MHRVLERQLRRLGIGDGPPTPEQWTKLLERVDAAYIEADRDRYTLERSLDLSSTEMRKRFGELRDAQRQLVEASRKAGMADLATSVLHNIGNVLNSVNVSANVVLEQTRSSARDGLGKALDLLRGQADPGKFLDEDPRGKKLLDYLGAVRAALGAEAETTRRELLSLAKHVDHLKSIVSAQLAAARGQVHGAKVRESIVLDELADDAIGVVRATIEDPSAVTFVRDYGAIAADVDRHKVFQILTNLLANARDAVQERPGAGVVTVRTMRKGDGVVGLEVADDGVGIPAESISRIFAQGFTTKARGHGYGLHSSACAATELGGTLTARSPGPGCGAVFTLTFPSGHPRGARVSAPPVSSPARAEAAP